jgi:hypothetical protein
LIQAELGNNQLAERHFPANLALDSPKSKGQIYPIRRGPALGFLIPL